MEKDKFASDKELTEAIEQITEQNREAFEALADNEQSINIDFHVFQEKFKHDFEFGLYPEFNFVYKENEYTVFADLEYIYLGSNNKKLQQCDAYEQLLSYRFEDDLRLKDIWNELRFTGDLTDWQYRYSLFDRVFIQQCELYGVITEITEENDNTIYHVKVDETSYSCSEEELSYDLREETKKESRETYQDYLDRICGDTLRVKIVKEEEDNGHKQLLSWLKDIYIKVTTNNFEWKIIYPNNRLGNPVDGMYTDMFFEKDGKYTYIKYSIQYMYRCDEKGRSHPEEGIKYYVLHELRMDDLDETWEIPEPANKIDLNDTLSRLVNNYGRFCYVFDDIETAKKVVSHQLCNLIYPYTYLLNKEEQKEWNSFVTDILEKRIIFSSSALKIDFVDFGYEHIGCDSIIIDGDGASSIVEVVCYASEPQYNGKLQKLFDKQYKGKGYCILHCLSPCDVADF